MPAELKDWAGLLAGRRSETTDVGLKAPIERSKAGGSGAFRALGKDGSEYFVKPLNNYHGPRILISEHVVGRVGALIDGATCEVQRMEITEDHRGWQYTDGAAPLFLEPGTAHASLAVPSCFEQRPPLQYRAEDDNARRHAQIYAIYDWCWGGDSQWLVSQVDEHRYFSHDHGWYLPPEGPNWTIVELTSNADRPREYAESSTGFRREDLDEIAEKLNAVTREQLIAILSDVPLSWPATDEELECVGYFLERRAPAVAVRIASRLGVQP